MKYIGGTELVVLAQRCLGLVLFEHQLEDGFSFLAPNEGQRSDGINRMERKETSRCLLITLERDWM